MESYHIWQSHNNYKIIKRSTKVYTMCIDEFCFPQPEFLISVFFLYIQFFTLRVNLGQPNFGVIEINWNATPVSLKFEVRDANGSPVVSLNSTSLELKARTTDSKATIKARKVHRYCSLEVDLPLIVRSRLLILFVCTLAGTQPWFWIISIFIWWLFTDCSQCYPGVPSVWDRPRSKLFCLTMPKSSVAFGYGSEKHFLIRLLQMIPSVKFFFEWFLRVFTEYICDISESIKKVI